APGPRPSKRHPARPGTLAPRGEGTPARSNRWGDFRRSALDPQCSGCGTAWGAASVVPVPLLAGGGAPDLRGRPPRQEGTAEAEPWRAPPRTLPGEAGRAGRP